MFHINLYHFFSSMYVALCKLYKIFNMFSFYLFFQMQEVADCNCVYRNVVHHSAGERTQILHDVASDPTLPRTKTMKCIQCNHPEVVFFQVIKCTIFLFLDFVCLNIGYLGAFVFKWSETSTEFHDSLAITVHFWFLWCNLQAAARGEEGMTLFFVCCNANCGHRWREN
ncbi:hypothetical protein ZIOFF_030487 [Zingiber officinale]|uniref:TFIIS-type domain-containing protein n=1 Tax=Zingiber officinale TaxID=94328 RepID=A0A8J5GY57_ZINOF|nr:hypothetical protein ZIOFF_030487 [Zingiber officinale]